MPPIAKRRLETVQALGIIGGDGAGNMNLSSNVTRAEFAKMMISASVYKDEMGDEVASSLYKDVKRPLGSRVHKSSG